MNVNLQQADQKSHTLKRAEAVRELYEDFFGPGAQMIFTDGPKSTRALKRFRRSCHQLIEQPEDFDRNWRALLKAAHRVTKLARDGKVSVTRFGGEA